MKVRRHSRNYNFIGDTTTGMTFRWGKTFKDDPSKAPWPELADISISNHCSKGCSYCYRDSSPNNSFISLEDYEYILKSLYNEEWGNIFQVALGGGEPLEHPQFKEILEITKKYGIVANFTTNGVHLNYNKLNEIKGLVGAIAISVTSINEIVNTDWYKHIKEFNNYFKINLHVILSRDSIKNAIDILEGKYNDVLDGINAIIFLTYKPAGRANSDNILSNDVSFKKFMSLIDKNSCCCSIGFDACFVPMLLSENAIDTNYIDSCECGYFSIYIDEKMNVMPCSFCDKDSDKYNLEDYTFDEIWNNKLESYRSNLKNSCKNVCTNKNMCRGSCPYYSNITLCYIGGENNDIS
ncbi:MAG: radical SAM protein [Clostridia bacterium]|nr:radical SAM protein [Clostridia bacterium]